MEYTKKHSQFLTHSDEAVKQSLENVQNNLEWRKDHADEVFKTISAFSFDQRAIDVD